MTEFLSDLLVALGIYLFVLGVVLYNWHKIKKIERR